jgi:hypothetical protein
VPECSLDKIFLEADSLSMFRKSLALLLICAWAILFGTVIFKNVDGFGFQFHRSVHPPTWSGKPAAVLTDDTVESNGDTLLSRFQGVQAGTAEPVISLTGLQRCCKLHKIHRVFLI